MSKYSFTAQANRAPAVLRLKWDVAGLAWRLQKRPACVYSEGKLVFRL